MGGQRGQAAQQSPSEALLYDEHWGHRYRTGCPCSQGHSTGPHPCALSIHVPCVPKAPHHSTAGCHPTLSLTPGPAQPCTGRPGGCRVSPPRATLSSDRNAPAPFPAASMELCQYVTCLRILCWSLYPVKLTQDSDRKLWGHFKRASSEFHSVFKKLAWEEWRGGGKDGNRDQGRGKGDHPGRKQWWWI